MEKVKEVLDPAILKMKRKQKLIDLMPIFGFVIITVIMIIATKGKILSKASLSNLVVQVFTITLVGVGAVFVYAHGGMDFSIGSISGLSQFICAYLMVRLGCPAWLGILGSIFIGMLCCGITGTVAITLGVHPFVGSLCVKTVAAGLLSVFAESAGGQISIDYSRYLFFNSTWLRLIVLLVMVALGFYLFENTKLGKIEKAIGGNGNTVQQAGINVKKYKLVAYLILGACVGVAAFFQLTRLGQVSSSSGSGLEFNMMIAMVLGGFPMSGGSYAKFRQFILGGITMTILSSGLIMCGLDVSLVAGVKGLIMLLIVALTYDRSVMKQVTMISF
ncbi:MAG: ABC transporter permease [Spirochaetales bacterium]|nr:ABC transporter permease [Spirochaetales bacterium]MBQ3831277.1 ABC transporter permease [Spirochaetales bacterium]MBQ4501726.1 ABC transporter permease [Spirochaetales bacterium]MBQ7281753.1 ABC transporter permease [Spirochaetales bacterium]MBQ9809536.1 ABC transporter permease [Spirochaetales bacterium]